MTKLTYHVGAHDGGYGYRLGDVWSETFADHDVALSAAEVGRGTAASRRSRR